MQKQKKIIIQSLEDIKKELKVAENKFNLATDPILIDSCIYEIKSLHMKHKFYSNLLKQIIIGEQNN